MTYFPPTQGPGRPFGQPTPRLTEQELREDAEIHARHDGGRVRVPWWRRLARKRRARARGENGMSGRGVNATPGHPEREDVPRLRDKELDEAVYRHESKKRSAVMTNPEPGSPGLSEGALPSSLNKISYAPRALTIASTSHVRYAYSA